MITAIVFFSGIVLSLLPGSTYAGLSINSPRREEKQIQSIPFRIPAESGVKAEKHSRLGHISSFNDPLWKGNK
jgi:hypothetical protein